jgi:hypothetical protein
MQVIERKKEKEHSNLGVPVFSLTAQAIARQRIDFMRAGSLCGMNLVRSP